MCRKQRRGRSDTASARPGWAPSPHILEFNLAGFSWRCCVGGAYDRLLYNQLKLVICVIRLSVCPQLCTSRSEDQACIIPCCCAAVRKTALLHAAAAGDYLLRTCGGASPRGAAGCRMTVPAAHRHVQALPCVPAVSNAIR